MEANKFFLSRISVCGISIQPEFSRYAELLIKQENKPNCGYYDALVVDEKISTSPTLVHSPAETSSIRKSLLKKCAFC